MNVQTNRQTGRHREEDKHMGTRADRETDVQIEALKTNDMLIPILSGSVKAFITDRQT